MAASLSVPLAGLTVTIGDYQWGYVGGRLYGERTAVATEYGTVYRKKTGTVQEHRRVRFEHADAVIEGIRRVAIVAGRKALPVIFTPDVAVPAVAYIVDWPEQQALERVLDNRQGVELDLLEHSPGV